MNVTKQQWEKLILRWSTVAPSPEAKLLVAVIAQAIEDVSENSRRSGLDAAFSNHFFVGALPMYCDALGISRQFLLERLQEAAA